MPHRPETRRLAANLLLALGAVFVSLALVELGCQLYARLVIYPMWDRSLAQPNFFVTRSEDPVLAYELAPNLDIDHYGKRLHINRFGLREDTDDLFEGRRKIAILGDSVTLAVGHSQDRTIDHLLEQRLQERGTDAVVLNFGVGGYGTRELAEFLKRKDAIYDVDLVVYLLNPNDFARRDSVYEGADNGLYRMYVRPTFLTPWFVRKAVYRVMKGSGAQSVRWYRWLFGGNEERGLADIREMARYCAEAGARFSVVLLPSAEAYGAGGYALADMYERVAERLAAEGIPVLAPIDAFADEPRRYYDETDHFVDAGNERIADLIVEFGLADAGWADALPARTTGTATTGWPAGVPGRP